MQIRAAAFAMLAELSIRAGEITKSVTNPNMNDILPIYSGNFHFNYRKILYLLLKIHILWSIADAKWLVQCTLAMATDQW